MKYSLDDVYEIVSEYHPDFHFIESEIEQETRWDIWRCTTVQHRQTKKFYQIVWSSPKQDGMGVMDSWDMYIPEMTEVSQVEVTSYEYKPIKNGEIKIFSEKS